VAWFMAIVADGDKLAIRADTGSISEIFLVK
jgi:hypothetical protein